MGIRNPMACAVIACEEHVVIAYAARQCSADASRYTWGDTEHRSLASSAPSKQTGSLNTSWTAFLETRTNMLRGLALRGNESKYSMLSQKDRIEQPAR